MCDFDLFTSSQPMQVSNPTAFGQTPYNLNEQLYQNTIMQSTFMQNQAAMQNQMLMNQPVLGRVGRDGLVHYTKQQIITGLQQFVLSNTGVNITKIEKLDDMPQVLKHACAPIGISGLQLCQFNVPEMNISVPFYFCKACGKLYYVKDFM